MQETYNKIISKMHDYAVWNEHMSFYMFNDQVHRGLGRWHVYTAEKTYCKHIELAKLIADIEDTIPKEALMPENDMQPMSLESHLRNWYDKCENLKKVIGDAIKECSNEQKYGEIYSCLICIYGCLEKECYAIWKLSKVAEFNKYDNFWVSTTMRKLHNHFRDDPSYDFDI